MTHPTTDSILYALFCLSRDTQHIDARELGLAVGVSTTEAAQALIALEHQGLVDATRARLTMPGLARAAGLAAGGVGGPRTNVDLRHARPRVASKQVPIAARSVPPAAPAKVPTDRSVHERQERRVHVVLGVVGRDERSEDGSPAVADFDARM